MVVAPYLFVFVPVVAPCWFVSELAAVAAVLCCLLPDLSASSAVLAFEVSQRRVVVAT